MRARHEMTMYEVFIMLKGFCKIIGDEPVDRDQWNNIASVFGNKLVKGEGCPEEIVTLVNMIRGYLQLTSWVTPTPLHWSVIREMVLSIP